MNMNWLESILYALISGLTQFLPVSAQAHKSILLCLFGQDGEHPLMGLFIHISVLTALIMRMRPQIKRLYREYALRKIPKRHRRRTSDQQSLMDISLIKLASVPMLLGFLLYPRTSVWAGELYLVALFLLVNGLLLHIPMYLPAGNKDSRSLSRLDGLLVGIGSAAAVLPGVSRIGAAASIAACRGADLQQAYKWSLLLSIPAVAVMVCFDIFAVIAGGLASVEFLFVLQCVLASGLSYMGAYVSITLMRSVVQRSGLSGFSYYCWGAGLFAFILYLI